MILESSGGVQVLCGLWKLHLDHAELLLAFFVGLAHTPIFITCLEVELEDTKEDT